MWGALGDITFEAINSPLALDRRQAIQYAEHEVVAGRPALQWTGDGLTNLRLSLRLHIQIAPVDSAIERLDAMAAAHLAQPLIMGDGRQRGHYVIARINETTRRTDSEGRTISADLVLELKEFVERRADSGPSLPPGSRRPAVLSLPSVPPAAVPLDEIVRRVDPSLAPIPLPDPSSIALPDIVRRARDEVTGAVDVVQSTVATVTAAADGVIRHLSQAGDRWDNLAHRYLGDARMIADLIAANPHVRIDAELPGGLNIDIPIPPAQNIIVEELPPWKL